MNKQTKILIGIAAGIILFGVIYFYFRGRNSSARRKHTRRQTRTAAGDIHYADGNVSAAIQEYGKSSNPEAKITQALIVANDIGDFDRAEKILDNVAERNPELIPDIEEILQTFAEERERQILHDEFMDVHEMEILYQQMLLNDATANNMTPPVETKIRDDPQNVHDHFVQTDYKLGVEKLKNISAGDPKFDIRQFEESLEPNSAEKKVFQHIKDLSDFNIGEDETPLELIKMALQVPKTAEEKENLQNELRLELKSALGPGGVVCMTGIRTRILGALEVIDEKFKLRPEWAMTEEITSKIAQYRENILNSFTDEQRTKYNAGDINIEQRVRDEAKKMFDTEYSYLSAEDRERFSHLFLAL